MKLVPPSSWGMRNTPDYKVLLVVYWMNPLLSQSVIVSIPISGEYFES